MQNSQISRDVETARKVGSRHGKPVVYHVDTEMMQSDGFLFFESVKIVSGLQNLFLYSICGKLDTKTNNNMKRKRTVLHDNVWLPVFDE
jgi:hypothetical protein